MTPPKTALDAERRRILIEGAPRSVSSLSNDDLIEERAVFAQKAEEIKNEFAHIPRDHPNRPMLIGINETVVERLKQLNAEIKRRNTINAARANLHVPLPDPSVLPSLTARDLAAMSLVHAFITSDMKIEDGALVECDAEPRKMSTILNDAFRIANIMFPEDGEYEPYEEEDEAPTDEGQNVQQAAQGTDGGSQAREAPASAKPKREPGSFDNFIKSKATKRE